MLEFLRHLFTGKDNATFDLGRLLWAKGCVAFIGLSGYSIYKGGPFDAVAWGTGFAAVLAAGGAAIWAKRDTEPGDGK